MFDPVFRKNYILSIPTAFQVKQKRLFRGKVAIAEYIFQIWDRKQFDLRIYWWVSGRECSLTTIKAFQISDITKN